MLTRSLIGLASPMRFRASLRPWILLLATLAWLWANSVFTPWAEDRAPVLWLYDLLFYLRFVLLFWGGGELLRLALRRGSRTDTVPLAATVLVVLVALGYQHSETGLRWKIAASSDALAAIAHDGDSDRRRRVGHFIVDSLRMPCANAKQAWLWLGRPHGGGTGTNLALVRGGDHPPATPLHDAFAFWPARDGWWLAYQHGGRYQRALAQRTPGDANACVPGVVLSRHRQGLALVADGRHALARK
jgi:hypothetical protein